MLYLLPEPFIALGGAPFCWVGAWCVTYGTFPHSPHRTRRASFPATGSPGMVILFRFHSFTLRNARTSSDLLLPFYSRKLFPGALPLVRGFPALRLLQRLRRFHQALADCSPSHLDESLPCSHSQTLWDNLGSG